MITPADQPFLRRALRLAMNGRGHVEPNPMVGCVLVKGGRIIGEGWHAKVGEAHAEPNALADCRARGNDPAGATAYVTLEPCCHVNKRTPPCVPQLIGARIARVAVGCIDASREVNGLGVAMLRAEGIDVDVLPSPLAPVPPAEGWGEGLVERWMRDDLSAKGVLSSPPPTVTTELDASHFRQLIAPFAARHIGFHDPYLTLKWAESVDGRVAGKNGCRVQISNAASSRFVHQLRARSAAIIVGINTVLSDDPLLNVRGIDGASQPARVVLDRDLRIPADAAMLVPPGDRAGGQVIVLCSKATYRDSPRVNELKNLGVEVGDLDDLDLALALRVNASFIGFTRHREFLVETGPTLARALLPGADRLLVTRSPIKLQAGPSAPRAATIPDHWVKTASLDLAGDTLTEYLNTRSPAFFAATPSADLVLAAEAAGMPLELP